MRFHLHLASAASDFTDPELRNRAKQAPFGPISRLFQLFADGREAALVVLDVWQGSDDVVIYKLFVARPWRGSGVGTAALAAVEEYTTTLGRTRVKLLPRSHDPAVVDDTLVKWYGQRGYDWDKEGLGFLVRRL